MSTCTETEFLTVIENNPLLCSWGWWSPTQGRLMKIDFEGNRNSLKSCFDEFVLAVKWLSKCQTTKTANSNSPSSYTLKHSAERATENYISNGALIAAALHLGVPVKAIKDSPNPYIGISRRDLVYLAASKS